jgi:hypothetical protein
MVVKTWNIQPLYATIVEVLDRKGSMSDSELFEFLKAFNKDVNVKELNEVLMKMEVTGLITVSSLRKGKNHVELIKK